MRVRWYVAQVRDYQFTSLSRSLFRIAQAQAALPGCTLQADRYPSPGIFPAGAICGV